MSRSASDNERDASVLLLNARASGAVVEPVRHLLRDDVDGAYRVQELTILEMQSESNPRVGRKVGLTSLAVQRQLNVDQPDFGVLLADMDATALEEVPSSKLLQPRIEAELAFVLGSDVDDPERVLDSVESVVAALEVVDSRIRDWDISLVDTIADNASCGMYVLGEERRSLDDLDPVGIEMSLYRNGERASAGTGADCLGDPRLALLWVARTAHRLGRPLKAGEVVLSGALGPMVPFDPGTRITATLSGVGTVHATASKE